MRICIYIYIYIYIFFFNVIVDLRPRIYVDYRDRFRILVYVFQSCLHQWKSVQLEIMRPRRCMQCNIRTGMNGNECIVRLRDIEFVEISHAYIRFSNSFRRTFIV